MTEQTKTQLTAEEVMRIRKFCVNEGEGRGRDICELALKGLRLERENAELVAALEMIATQKREGDIPQQVVRMQRIARAAIAKATGK